MNLKRILGFSILFFIILFSLSILHIRTGFFSGLSEIDTTDLAYWNYSEGKIIGTDEFKLSGNNDTCWLLIHSYASTPREYIELANTIHSTFNDSVYVPKLLGHGEVPSHILNLSLDDWYLQMNSDFSNLSNYCNEINIVGSSFGGAIATKIAETRPSKLNNLYLVNAYLSTPFNWYTIVPPEVLLKLSGNLIKYNKKTKIAQLNSLEGRSKHIAYWSMPLITVKNSLNFLKETKLNLAKINATTLVIHSHNDKTADYKNADLINTTISSKVKNLLWFDDSNHLLLLDYSKGKILNEIIQWETENRED